jgi:hypothetical protein
MRPLISSELRRLVWLAIISAVIGAVIAAAVHRYG